MDKLTLTRQKVMIQFALGVVQPSSYFREVGDQTSNRVGFPWGLAPI